MIDSTNGCLGDDKKDGQMDSWIDEEIHCVDCSFDFIMLGMKVSQICRFYSAFTRCRPVTTVRATHC